MRLSAELDPREEVRTKFRHEGEVPYTVEAGDTVLSGTVLVSTDEETSGVRVIPVVQVPGSTDVSLEAPDPVVVRKNRTMAWSNKTSSTVRVEIG